MIDFRCPKCGNMMIAPEPRVGQNETCPACGNVCAVPRPNAMQGAVTSAGPQESRVVVEIASPLRGVSGFGLASIVLGVIACMSCWIPYIGCLGLPLSVFGLIFGVIGVIFSVFGRKSGAGLPAAGAAVCLVAILMVALVTGGLTAVIDKASKNPASTVPASYPSRNK